MKKILTIAICCTFLQAAIAQRSLTITYRSTAQLNAEALINLTKDKKNNIVSDTARKTDSSKTEELYTEAELRGFIDSISSTPLIETRRIYREGDFVIIRNNEGPVFHKYNMKTLTLAVLDSSLYPTFSRIDTMIYPMLDDQFIYTVKKTSETKTISGYQCEKFLIVQDHKQDEQEVSEFIVWATRQIKPTIPIFAVLELHKIILEEYTALQISEKMPWLLNSSNETEVIKIEKN